MLNAYLDKCLDIVATFDDFVIFHMPHDNNWRANKLAQQASGYNVHRGLLFINDRSVLSLANIETGEPHLDSAAKNVDNQVVAAEEQDWRKPIIDYLQDPSKHVDRAIRQTAFKYALMDDELFWRTVDGMLHKCLSVDQERVAMG